MTRLPSGYDVKRLVSEFADVVGEADPRGKMGGGRGMVAECCEIVNEVVVVMAGNAREYGRGGQEAQLVGLVDEIENGLRGMGERVFVGRYGSAVGKEDYRTSREVADGLIEGAGKLKEVGDEMGLKCMKEAKRECGGEGWEEKVEGWRGKIKGGRGEAFMIRLVEYCASEEITRIFLERKKPLEFLNPITDLKLRVESLKEGEGVMEGMVGREMGGLKDLVMWEEGGKGWREMKDIRKR